MQTDTTIYVLVNRLEGDLRDDVEYASADSFVAAFTTAGAALDAAKAYLVQMEAIGEYPTVEVIREAVYASWDARRAIDATKRRESIATLFTE